VAVALARSSSHPLRVIYVTTTRDKGRRRRNVSVSLFEEEAILKETIALAARYDVEVITTLRTNTRRKRRSFRRCAAATSTSW
jgi:hypothetical protein